MKEVLDILKDQSIVGYLATVDDGMPRVRPWGFMFEENGRLYFCTASVKEAYQQMTKVPYVEFSKTTKDMVWVRVKGKIEFDESIEIKQRILDTVPMLKGLYKSADNPIFKVFYMEHGTAAINDFTPNPPRTYEF